jgi:hypothetical protein
MALKIRTSISGSVCVVFRTQEHYIDCRIQGTHTRIECVRDGKLYRVVNEINEYAPKTTMQVIREEFYGHRPNR